MRKTCIKLLLLLLAMLLVVMPLASCGNVGSLKIFKDGESKYRIVYENGNREAGNAAENLASQLEKKAGVVLEVTDDRTEVDKKIPEILVGRTNRGTDLSWQRTIRYGSYVIVREKKNVYILGAGDGVVKKACEDFLKGLLDAGGKISGKGELLSSEKEYHVDAVTLNGRAVTDYTVYLPEKSSVDFEEYVGYVEAQLIDASGLMLTIATYTDLEKIPGGPALVLKKDDTLGDRGYSIAKQSDEVLHVSVGSDSAAMALAIAFMERIDDKKAEIMELTLAEDSGKVGETSLVPLTGSADLRVMCFNVYGNDEHKKLMPYVSATSYAYAADFILMQEFYEVAYDTVGKDLESAGYGLVGDKFTEVSPTALEHKDDDAYYQKFAYVGGTCYTPIYYRTDIWEPVESGAYLFYWMNRYHCSNTKSLAYGVFRNKTTGEQVAVISTHFPLMGDGYKSVNKDGRDYSTCTDKKEGAEWRYGAALEILKQVDALRAEYPGVRMVVGGDLNAVATEKSVKTIEEHTVLSNSSVMAPADAKDAGGSFHDYNKAPGATALPIDHLFVSEDVAIVLQHRIVADVLTVKGTDHCPVVVDIQRK